LLWFDQVDAAALVDADTKDDDGGRARVLRRREEEEGDEEKGGMERTLGRIYKDERIRVKRKNRGA